MQLINNYEIKEFYYDSKEERDIHEKEMVENGWICSGQIRKTIGSLMEKNPKSVWYACYCKYYNEQR